jgi:hypothetical protein
VGEPNRRKHETLIKGKRKKPKPNPYHLSLTHRNDIPGIPPMKSEQTNVGVSTGEPQDCFAVEIPETIGTGNRSYVLYIDIPTNSGCRTCRSDIRRRIHNETEAAIGVAVDIEMSCRESWHVRARECNHKPGDFIAER